MHFRLGDASPTDLDAGRGSHHHVHHTDLGQLIEDLPRFVSQPGALAKLSKRFPQDIRQKANENVRLDPLLLLVPDRP